MDRSYSVAKRRRENKDSAETSHLNSNNAEVNDCSDKEKAK